MTHSYLNNAVFSTIENESRRNEFGAEMNFDSNTGIEFFTKTPPGGIPEMNKCLDVR